MKSREWLGLVGLVLIAVVVGGVLVTQHSHHATVAKPKAKVLSSAMVLLNYTRLHQNPPYSVQQAACVGVVKQGNKYVIDKKLKNGIFDCYEEVGNTTTGTLSCYQVVNDQHNQKVLALQAKLTSYASCKRVFGS